MPFLIRPSRRFPVCCPITYQCGDFEGHGTVWNVSLTGWHFFGMPLKVGDMCSLTVNLPSEPPIYVAAGVVHWVQRGEEYRVETLVIDDESQKKILPRATYENIKYKIVAKQK